MPNRQPPNDPNLERDLWGDDDRLNRPRIDLAPKQRSDQAEMSNWDDQGETSNWDDADDDDREYDDIPAYGSSPAVQNSTGNLGRDSDAIAETEPGAATANIGDPELFDAIDNDAEMETSISDRPSPPPSQYQSEYQSETAPMPESEDDTSLNPGSVSETTTDDLAMNSDNDELDEEPTYQSETLILVMSETGEAGESGESAGGVDEAPSRDMVMIAASVSEEREVSTVDVERDDREDLAAQAEELRQEIAQLQAQKSELQADLSRLVRESLQDLTAQRQELQTSVEKLERRQARIQEEMQTTFAGASQDLAVRVQGFKEYLVGSLQDLSLAAERLKLSPETPSGSRTARTAPRDSAPQTAEPSIRQATGQPIGQPIRQTTGQPRSPRTSPQDLSRERSVPPLTQQPPQPLRTERPDRPEQPERLELNDRRDQPERNPERNIEDPNFGKKGFQDQASFIRSTLDRYRDRPDYYGPPWQLRRTFQPVQADRVSDWFFNQSGRGVVRSMGSRLQNILIASTTISILRGVYDKRLRALVLANSPERLGEWRRGLQDCLGITRNDFGPDRGITLFEDPMLMAQKAERLVKAGWLPLIVMDESEAQLNLSLLQFPLWLAFAADPSRAPSFDRDWMVR